MGDARSHSSLPLVGGWYSFASDCARAWSVVRDPRSYRGENGQDDKREKEKEQGVQQGIQPFSVNRGYLHLIYRIVVFLLSLPLWLIPRRGRPARQKAMHELHPLSYLDALRGYLSMMIYFSHVCPRTWHWIPSVITNFPWTAVPFRGGMMGLDMFFWISGYAVTYRIVGLIHTKRSDKVLDALASTMFRRYLRLFLPVLPIMYLNIVGVKYGIVVPPEDRQGAKEEIIKDGILWFFYWDLSHLMNPFTKVTGWWNQELGSRILDPYWSLTAEYRSSMTFLGFLVSTCRMPARWRMRLTWVAIALSMTCEANYAGMGFLGLWFADCRQARVQKQKAVEVLPASPTQADSKSKSDASLITDLGLANSPVGRLETSWKNSRVARALSKYKNPLLYAILIYSFLYLDDPHHTEKKKYWPAGIINYIARPWWKAQSRMHWHLFVGIFMLTYPLDRLETLQYPLRMQFSQYLGELSFGIFAVHWPIRWILWDPRYVEFLKSRYDSSFHGKFWAILPGFLGMTIVVFWAAEFFRRCDAQVVRFCKWLEERLFEH
ncbi:hypothetical protein R6Q59_010210 [Mikania micrantha]